MSLFLLQHGETSTKMLKHLVKVNDLEKEMRNSGLDPEKDLIFIEEMINGPLGTETTQDKGDKEMMDPEKKETPWPYRGRSEEKSFLYEIVSNKRNGIDVDKFDYFARDCQNLGMKNNFDYRRFLHFARVYTFDKKKQTWVRENVDGEKQICIRDKEAVNIYNMFHTRYYLHKRAFQHTVTKIIETMITDAFLKADKHIKIEGSKRKMFTLSEAIDDMEAYTKLTDHVFEQILFSSSNELKEAREILKRIISRDLYRFLWEMPIKKSIDVVKNAWDAEMDEPPQGLQSDDFAVLVIALDYGMKDKNPVDQMYFYTKKNPDEAVKLPKEKVSQILPTNFSEKIIRFYCKKTDEESLSAAKAYVKQWCEKNQEDRDNETPGNSRMETTN